MQLLRHRNPCTLSAYFTDWFPYDGRRAEVWAQLDICSVSRFRARGYVFFQWNWGAEGHWPVYFWFWSKEIEKEKPILELESIWFHYTCTVGTRNRLRATCISQKANFAERSIQFWQMGFNDAEALVQLSYQSHGEVSSTFLLWIAEMNSTTSDTEKERSVTTDDETFGRLHAICFEETGVLWMKDDAPKHTSQGKAVLKQSLNSCSYHFYRKILHVASKSS